MGHVSLCTCGELGDQWCAVVYRGYANDVTRRRGAGSKELSGKKKTSAARSRLACCGEGNPSWVVFSVSLVLKVWVLCPRAVVLLIVPVGTRKAQRLVFTGYRLSQDNLNDDDCGSML